MRDHRVVIKAIIFDLGRVIVPFDFQRGLQRLSDSCGIPVAEIPGLLTPAGLLIEFECGRIDSADFYRRMTDLLGLKATEKEFCDIWTSIFLPHTLIQEDFLEALTRRYRVVLLSNTNAIHFRMLRESYPLLRHIHSYVLSYEVGAMKPSPLIYQRAVEAAGCRAEECFFTDDIAEYVEGAKQQGIDAVQFESQQQIQRELKARGVRWE